MAAETPEAGVAPVPGAASEGAAVGGVIGGVIGNLLGRAVHRR